MMTAADSERIARIEEAVAELLQHARRTEALEQEMKPMIEMAKRAAKFKFGGGKFGGH